MADDIAHIIANYEPGNATLERLRSVVFVAVVGPIGVGKTTLIDEAIKRDKNKAIHLVIGDTSRAPRPGEQAGVDYYFRTKAAMIERIRAREYVQVPPNITGDLYATSPENYAQDGIAVMAVWANALPQFRTLPFKSMRTIFVLPPDFATWQKRLAIREGAAAVGGQKLSGHSISKNAPAEAVLTKRLAEARTSLAFARQDTQTLFVINGDLETALKDFLALANGEKLPPRLAAVQRQGREHAATLLGQLNEFLLRM